MEKIVFVILHYKLLDMTEKCVEYLLKQDYENFQLIIIDNCSQNGSYEKLCKLYNENTKVELISTEYNYGFAKGNNIGYLIAKYKYGAEYIVVMNNDLFICDSNFCKKLIKDKYEDNVGVIGPDIINIVGEHQNPLHSCITTKKELKKAIFITRIKLLLIPLVYGIVIKYKKRMQVQSQVKKEEKMWNVPLHGSCLIFTRKFIDHFEYAFFPDTFLYGEEDILFYCIKKAGLSTLFYPEIVVSHMEDATTNSLFGKTKDKRLFELKNSLHSLCTFMKIWK